MTSTSPYIAPSFMTTSLDLSTLSKADINGLIAIRETEMKRLSAATIPLIVGLRENLKKEIAFMKTFL